MLRVYSDGGARGNPGPSAFAFIIFDNSNQLVKEYSEYFADKETNNRAEYMALLRAVETINKDFADKNVVFYSDSQLLINQMNGGWRVKDNRLRTLRQRIMEEMVKLGSFRFEWVSRENIYIGRADELVNQKLDENKKRRFSN
jgi:ribonuclease HI